MNEWPPSVAWTMDADAWVGDEARARLPMFLARLFARHTWLRWDTLGDKDRRCDGRREISSTCQGALAIATHNAPCVPMALDCPMQVATAA
jgi:hypothetical protein